MSLKIKRTVTVKDTAGHDIILSDNDKSTVTTDAIFVCDNQRCASRNGEFATTFSWNEEKAQQDFRSLPDGFFQLIKIQPDSLRGEEQVIFCCAQCAKDWLTYSYIRPLGKAEHTQKLQVEVAAQLAIEAQNPQMKLPFTEPEATCP